MGLFGKDITHRVVAEVSAVAPGSAGQFVQQLLSQVQSHKRYRDHGRGGVLWSASSYVNGFRMTAISGGSSCFPLTA